MESRETTPTPEGCRVQGANLDVDDVDSGLLQEEKDLERYQSGRNGDNLMGVPFECDLYHLRNMNQRNPTLGSKRDEDIVIEVRRAQLDVPCTR